VTVAHRRAIAALLAAVLFVAVAVMAPESAYSAGGALDATFDTDGSATLDFGNGTDSISDLALQSDGKIVAVGPSGTGFGLVRYTTLGALDTTFGVGGFTSGAFMSDARDVAVQSDGKIVVVGRSASTDGSLVVARYTAFGALDTTFDGDGRVSVAMTGASSGGLAIAIQTDAKIVALANDNGLLSVFRFTTVGALDTTFDTDGRVVTTAAPSLFDRIAVQSDGSIVFTNRGVGADGGIIRLTTLGALDTTYDADGSATSINHLLRALAVQSDNKTIAAGDLGSSDNKALVVRRLTDGSLDPAFGTGGVVTFAVTGLTRASAHAITIQSDGKIVVTGRLDDTPVPSAVFVARLTTLGVLDTTFATGGIATFSTVATKSTSTADGVAIDSTGRFVVGGSVVSASGVPNDTDFHVFRVLPTDTPATTTTTRPTTTTTTIPGSTAAGGTAQSDPDDMTPTEDNPLVIEVVTPVTGVFQFTKELGDPVDGARVIAGVDIQAPSASAVEPLRISFSVDLSTVPGGFPIGGVLLLRDGDQVPECFSSTTATPDPCISGRARDGNALTITTLTSEASFWQLIEPIVLRVAGETRIESAVEASRSSFADGSASAAVVARADGFADALAATPLAVAKNGPLLLSQSSDLDDATLAEITRVLPPGGTVYLLGGTGALSPAVELRLLSWGYPVTRLAGANRYETAVAVARDGLESPDVVVETTGLGFADALAAGAVAARLGAAVLLTEGTEQSDATSSYIASVNPTRYAIGGPAALADLDAGAIFGADRYETAVLAAIAFFPGTDLVGLASGAAFPDALAGGAHAAFAGAPLLLVPPDGPLPVSLAILFRDLSADLDPPTAFLYGGSGAVSDLVASDVVLSIGG
jgi:uncharacterized delta-60 repeat protein